MKKTNLVLFPVLAALLLAGCTATKKSGKKKKSGSGGSEVTSKTSTSGGGGGGGGSSSSKSEAPKDPRALTEDITIDYDVLKSNFDQNTYPKSDYTFTAGGFNFNATSGVGWKVAEDEGKGNYYNEQHALQFRKQGHEKGVGKITIAEPAIASSITIRWFAAGYATEPEQYLPVVYVGDSASSVNTAVKVEGDLPAVGTPTGGKQSWTTGSGESAKTEDRDVYIYTSVFKVTGKNYFAVSAPGGALYVKDIVINK